MLRNFKVAEASVHDTKLPQRPLTLEAPRMSPGCANARCPAVLEPERLQQTTDEVRRSQHLSDRERWHGRVHCDDFFRTPACLVGHRAHALCSELDEHGVAEMGKAWLVAVGHHAGRAVVSRAPSAEARAFLGAGGKRPTRDYMRAIHDIEFSLIITSQKLPERTQALGLSGLAPGTVRVEALICSRATKTL